MTNNFYKNLYLLLGQLLAQVSDRMMMLGLIWSIGEQFGVEWISWYLVVSSIPHLLFCSLSGPTIKKLGSLNVVISADIFRGILFTLSCLFIHQISTHNDLIQILIVVFISNCMAAFFNPAIFTLPTEYENDLSRIQKLTAQLSTVTSLSLILGPVLGIYCFKKLGLNWLLLFTSISYFASAFFAKLFSKIQLKDEGKELIEQKISTSAIEDETSHSPPKMLQSLKSNILISTMLILFLFMNILLGPLQVFIPHLAQNTFLSTFDSMAKMEILFGFGIIIGSMLLSFMSINKSQLLISTLLLQMLSMAYIGLSLSQTLSWSMLALFCMGIALGLANVLLINIFQNKPKSAHIPNIMSFVNLISTAALPFSLSILAILQKFYGLDKIVLYCAILLTVVCFSSIFLLRMIFLTPYIVWSLSNF